MVGGREKGEMGEKKTAREDLEIFEGTFNHACFSIAKGEYGAAAVLLKRAKRRFFGWRDGGSDADGGYRVV